MKIKKVIILIMKILNLMSDGGNAYKIKYSTKQQKNDFFFLSATVGLVCISNKELISL